MKKLSFVIILFLLGISGCSAKNVDKEVWNNTPSAHKEVNYTQDIQPLFDRRCVVCHSCYNSPCQLKLSSYDGVMRGGSKIKVYDNRLTDIEPTRLYIDAANTKEWHTKGFYSVTQKSDSKYNDSIMMYLLEHKNKQPIIQGEYYSEDSNLTCAKDEKEVMKFIDKNPYSGMPFGFPAISDNEYQIMATWLYNGAKGPEKNTKLSHDKNSLAVLNEFEDFLNTPDLKHQVSARYIYEHLFLAHLYVDPTTKEYFELVRSYTPSPKPIEIVQTRKPYDDPNAKIYYRVRKIETTIVHKTHMTYQIDKAKIKRFQELFIQPQWEQEAYEIGFTKENKRNPFLTFEQIPTKSRYQFLLDDSLFFIRTFIRGPVCKGQIALDVIHDHFWVMFIDPEHDISVISPEFFKKQIPNLAMPITNRTNENIFEAIQIIDYHKKSQNYAGSRLKEYDKLYSKGVDESTIWKGASNIASPILTIYRHFDAASVHSGALGEFPRTKWVIDYPLFERIYYSLVAGFDVFGDLSHQMNVRLYMDRLRIEGENNFLYYLPLNERQAIHQSWNEGILAPLIVPYIGSENESGVQYKTKNYQEEFISHLIEKHFEPSIGLKFDPINFHENTEATTLLDKKMAEIAHYKQNFAEHLTDNKINIIYVRFKHQGRKDDVYSFIFNRWHNNVAFALGDDLRLNHEKDSLSIHKGFYGSYPNLFLEVDEEKQEDFFKLIKYYQGSDKERIELEKYAILRSDPKFWESYDWFQKRFNVDEPIESGIFDLNRYYPNSNHISK